MSTFYPEIKAEVLYADNAAIFHTPGDDGSRVDMLENHVGGFKPGWYFWPKEAEDSVEPSDDPAGPFATLEEAHEAAVNYRKEVES